MAANNNSIFTSFFDSWLSKQETFVGHLERLLSPENGFDRDRECGKMILRVLSHYQEFDAEKARAAAGDIFILISQPWLSSFERSLLWVSGYRPSMIFPIIEKSVAADLSGEQRRRMEELRLETRRREREINEAMARVQETVAEPPLCGLMKRFGMLVDGEVAEFGEAVEGLKAAMTVVVEKADELRGRTVVEVLGVLSPVQGARFLAAATRFQLQARKWGVEKDREREILAAANEA
ncbi:transcription factor hbp-1b(c38) [Phtheirospermum japonicum]|uniref:Transcription factor hbp-1b(C38) n=1 Tax=Phtheirospermum japonicum TaxID=374723 RepID=A0A830C4E1_9LAMI|nr:transcription factor hbp-1b(c38) [Phtheirospermum japonicum]